MTVLAACTVGEGPGRAAALLEASALGAVQLARPELDELPYAALVRAVLQRQGFRLDFNGMTLTAAIGMMADQLLGPGSHADLREPLAAEIAALADFMAALAGARPTISIRTYFAPGDLVWHVDRVAGADAFRLVWPIGRPAGMQVTPAASIDATLYRAFMRREFPLLCAMDSQVARTGVPIEQLWAHRPAQLEAMRTGRFAFLRDHALVRAVPAGAASIHRDETPAREGAYHRSSWANRDAPGFQIVITAGGA